MKFRISEFDKDYRRVISTTIMKFKNEKQASKYCDDNSWSGYMYTYEKLDKKSNSKKHPFLDLDY